VTEGISGKDGSKKNTETEPFEIKQAIEEDTKIIGIEEYNGLRIHERDIENEGELHFTDDIYNITISAILTRNCNPMEVNFCIKQCFFVFMS